MEGKLKHWNEDKGFGFISSNDTKDIFIHISALKHMNRRPIVGDIITFQIHIDNKGKKRATNANIQGVSSNKLNSKNHKDKPETITSNGWGIKFISLIVLIAIGYGLYTWYSPKPSTAVSKQTILSVNKTTTVKNFKCEGKQHCSEMTSCAEATFYINNCPNTKMDGDDDGVPCESQWCN